MNAPPLRLPARYFFDWLDRCPPELGEVKYSARRHGFGHQVLAELTPAQLDDLKDDARVYATAGDGWDPEVLRSQKPAAQRSRYRLPGS